MRTAEDSPKAPTIRVRKDEFDRLVVEPGPDRAGLLGVHRRTVGRLLDDGGSVGGAFIARVLTLNPELKFEDIFEVVNETSISTRAA